MCTSLMRVGRSKSLSWLERRWLRAVRGYGLIPQILISNPTIPCPQLPYHTLPYHTLTHLPLMSIVQYSRNSGIGAPSHSPYFMLMALAPPVPYHTLPPQPAIGHPVCFQRLVFLTEGAEIVWLEGEGWMGTGWREIIKFLCWSGGAREALRPPSQNAANSAETRGLIFNTAPN